MCRDTFAILKWTVNYSRVLTSNSKSNLIKAFHMSSMFMANEVMGCASWFELYLCLKSGRTLLDGKERSGGLSTGTIPKNVDKIRELVHEDDV